jgi:hypothetical protein
MFRELRPIFRKIDSKIAEIMGITVDVDALWDSAWDMMERRVKGAGRRVRPGAEVEIDIEEREKGARAMKQVLIRCAGQHLKVTRLLRKRIRSWGARSTTFWRASVEPWKRLALLARAERNIAVALRVCSVQMRIRKRKTIMRITLTVKDQIPNFTFLYLFIARSEILYILTARSCSRSSRVAAFNSLR